MKFLSLFALFLVAAVVCPDSPGWGGGDTDWGKCTEETVRHCIREIAPTLPFCEAGEHPEFNTKVCCYTCRPRAVDTSSPDCPEVPYCAEGVHAIFNQSSQCFTNCRPPNGMGGGPGADCSPEELRNCNMTNVPACPPGTLPTRTPDCCLTCRGDDSCNRTQLEACHENAPNLPVCAGGAHPEFDYTTCCRTCRPPPHGGPCRPEDRDSCLADTPVCLDGEIATRIEGSCCLSCKRPESCCSVDDVILCTRNSPECPEGVPAAFVPGECCASCRPPRPVCNPTCGDSQICARFPEHTAQCVDAFIIIITITRESNVSLESLRDLDLFDFRALIREFVSRWCERPENTEACLPFLNDDGLFQARIAGVELSFNDNEDIVVKIGLLEDDHAKRTTDAFPGLMSSAIVSEAPDNGFTVSIVSDSTTGSATGSDESAGSLLAVSCVSAVLLLLSVLF